MSVIYQGESFEVSNEELIQINSELGELQDELYICTPDSDEEYLEKLLERWENTTPITPQEELDWLEYENGRMESDLIDSENEWL